MISGPDTRGQGQILPGTGEKREALRAKGQFWTPDWVAETMVAYALGDDPSHLFDPAVGEGAFFRAAKNLSGSGHTRFLGTEIDPDTLAAAQSNGLSGEDLREIQITDFVLSPPRGPFKAIVANPPYIRHHRLSHHVKARLKSFSLEVTGRHIDGRAGLHVYFLLRALQLLDREGKLAFIMPADTCEGVFASPLWKWITQRHCLEAVVTFSEVASPFPKVDTNPVIFMIRNSKPEPHFLWSRCEEAGPEELKVWVKSGFNDSGSSLTVSRRLVAEGISTGLSRSPRKLDTDAHKLKDFARVLRGIATGANDFFFLTTRQTKDLEIPEEFLIPAIGRTRDVVGDEITSRTMEGLELSGRPTWIFSPDSRPLEDFPEPVRRYIEEGKERGLSQKALISMRNPWYKMEVRSAPPFLFAYLGRRNARFIRNYAGVVPLTGFLCIYPKLDDKESLDRLWDVLQHRRTVENLSLIGKSYGSGAIKVEPRALERLPLPNNLVEGSGLGESEASDPLRLF